MKKPVEEMTDHEILVELLREKRGRDRARTAKYLLWAAVCIALAVLLWRVVPPVLAYFRALQEMLRQIQEGLDAVQSATDRILASAAEIGQSGQRALQEAADKLDALLSRVPRIFQR